MDSESRWMTAPEFLSFIGKDAPTLCKQIRGVLHTAETFPVMSGSATATTTAPSPKEVTSVDCGRPCRISNRTAAAAHERDQHQRHDLRGDGLVEAGSC